MTRHRNLALLWTRPVLASTVTVLAALWQWPCESATAQESTLYLSTSVAAAGSTVTIKGYGWPPGDALQASVCGDAAAQGSVDCAVDSAATFAAGTGGSIDEAMQIETPPRPCPCVVMVVGVDQPYYQLLPLTLVSAPTAAVPTEPAPAMAAPAPQYRAERPVITVKGGISIESLFGIRTERILEVTVWNSGTVPATATISARWGKGMTPSNLVTIPAPTQLAAGSKVTVLARFALNPLAMGAYRVEVDVAGFGPVSTGAATVTTSTEPWGLFAVVAGTVGLGVHRRLIRLRNRVRDRLRQTSEVSDTEADRAPGNLLGSGGTAPKPDWPHPQPTARVTVADV